MISSDPNLLGFYQSLTDLGAGKYPATASSSHPAPPKGRGPLKTDLTLGL